MKFAEIVFRVLGTVYLVLAIALGLIIDISITLNMVVAPMAIALIAVVAFFVIAMIVIGVSELIEDIVK